MDVVAPVVHGRWIIETDALWREYTVCSACHSHFECKDEYHHYRKLDFREMAYCPKCGAKME